MNEIWAAVITATGAIIAALITTYVWKAKAKSKIPGIHIRENGENPCKDILGASEAWMYSINSYALYNFVNDLLAQHPNVSIQRITLIVRKRDNESQRDLEALNQVIQNWHNLVTQKRILSLKIIATPHDINHYYSIFDSDSMFCGLVFHEDGLPSSTNVDYNPLFYTKESSIGQEMIKKYRTHFEHTMKRYEQKYLLYDSEKQEMGTNLRESAVI